MDKLLLLLYNVHAKHVAALQAIAPDWEIQHTTNKEKAIQLIARANVVMGNHNLCEALPYASNTLQWVQTNSVGVDYILNNAKQYLTDRIFTNAKGSYDNEISEHTIALILMLHRNLHITRDNQQKHIWNRPENLSTLQDKNALILGYGSLGKAIAQKLEVFGVHIFGVNTSTQFFEIHRVRKHWKELLSVIDILILALPFTVNTKNIIGQAELSSLSNQSIVINVGRPETINEKALLQKLIDKKIKAAALDVFSEEPLLADHVAWNIENLIISPHTARSKETVPPFQFEKLFEQNFERYIHNKPLLNVVDIQKGY